MLIQTKIYCELDETNWWDDYMFDLSNYISHSRSDDFSLLLLRGMDGPVTIQLSFEDLATQLQILNTFETISLN